MMSNLSLLLYSALLFCVEPVVGEPPMKELLKLHQRDAVEYSMAMDKNAKDVLVFRSEPIFAWTNPVSFGFQTGHIFVWTHCDRPEAIGTIFSVKVANKDKRMLVHEFHTLSENRLFPKTPTFSEEKWEPQVGVEFQSVGEDIGSDNSNNSNGRLRALKTIARTFAGQTIDSEKNQRQLRLLTTPLLRYAPKTGKIIDGALFAMVSSDGTDPEVLLMIEAIATSGSNPPTWRCAALRFSDKDIQVQRNGKEVWSSLNQPNHHCAIEKNYRLLFTPQRDYICYRSHDVDELPEVTAQTK